MNAFVAVALVGGVILGLLSAAAATEIATDRGRNQGWALAGFLFPVAGALLVWLMPLSPSVSGYCPHCHERVKSTASVCPHCTRDIPSENVTPKV